MTPGQYAANITSRFGQPPRGQSLEQWLASMENAAMRGRLPNRTGTQIITPEMRAILSERNLEAGRKRMAQLLEAMTCPMTHADMMQATGWAASTVSRALNRACEEGLIVADGKRKPQIWVKVP